MNENEKIVVHKQINDLCDSFEIGTPSKGGCIKIYGNANKLDEFKLKFSNMKKLREFAKIELSQ